VKEDNFDEEKEEIHVRCKPGDVWELGEHRLMCGDSIDLEHVNPLTGGGAH
jgi:site-specific DNA-methyltransferase (adenine-specific)